MPMKRDVRGSVTYFDIDNITTFVDFHVDRQRDASIFLEVACEQMARTAAITFRICHCRSGGTDEMTVLILKKRSLVKRSGLRNEQGIIEETIQEIHQ